MLLAAPTFPSSFIFNCCCGKCSHEDSGGGGDGDGEWRDPQLDDAIFTKYYMSKPAAQYRWPDNGKSDLPYDTGCAINDVSLPVTVQCPDGGVRILPSDLNQNLVTANPIPITGGGPPPVNSAYPGSGSRRQSLSRYGTISRSPSMPSLREERMENYNTMTLPRNARLRQQALINAGRRASYVDGSFPENRAGGVNVDLTGRRVSYSASSANDLGGTEGGAAINVNEAAQTAAAKPRRDATQKVDMEFEASAENGNGFLEPF